METFSALLASCVGNSLVTSEFPAQRPVTQSFDVLFDLRLNIWLSKQSLGWWFEMPLWHHCYVISRIDILSICCKLPSGECHTTSLITSNHCVFSLPISFVMIERMYTLSYFPHKIGGMNYYPLFRVRSWNSGMCCMSLYILIDHANI